MELESLKLGFGGFHYFENEPFSYLLFNLLAIKTSIFMFLEYLIINVLIKQDVFKLLNCRILSPNHLNLVQTNKNGIQFR